MCRVVSLVQRDRNRASYRSVWTRRDQTVFSSGDETIQLACRFQFHSPLPFSSLRFPRQPSSGVNVPEYILDLAREVSDRLLDGGFDFFEFLINAVVHAAWKDASSFFRSIVVSEPWWPTHRPSRAGFDASATVPLFKKRAPGTQGSFRSNVGLQGSHSPSRAAGQ